jgi:hypothetical protein
MSANDLNQPNGANTSTHQATAWAYDRKIANRRPIFRMTQILTHDGTYTKTERFWYSAGEQTACQEKAVWADRLASVATEMPFLAEQTHAVISSDHCSTQLKSHKTQHQQRERSIALPYEAITLATVPLMIAREWHALQSRQIRMASYLVLKVQRAATVRLECTSLSAKECIVSVTPTNLLLRAIFGSTAYVFEADRPRLLRIDGLLDPRDTKPNQRWIEYMGRIEFESPLDLSALMKGSSA